MYTDTFSVLPCSGAALTSPDIDLRAMSPEQRDAVLAAMSAASEAQQALLGCSHGQNLVSEAMHDEKSIR